MSNVGCTEGKSIFGSGGCDDSVAGPEPDILAQGEKWYRSPLSSDISLCILFFDRDILKKG